MFENSSIYVLTTKNDIMRLEIDADTQNAINVLFASLTSTVTSGKTGRLFSANYKLEEDEYFKIEGFQLLDEIMDAIRNPLGVTAYQQNVDEDDDSEGHNLRYPEIKAIFVGERIQQEDTESFVVAFQRYRREQNLVALPFRLFLSNNTFSQDKRFCIGISDNLDCCFVGNELQFNSFFFARQVFDLSGYYRSATDSEVTSFIGNKYLQFDDANGFKNIANSYVRRKIAMINDSDVLKNHSASEIKKLGVKVGLNIVVKDNKIVVPNDKDDAILLIAFLDEEAYRGPFSKDVLLANSKRVVKRNG